MKGPIPDHKTPGATATLPYQFDVPFEGLSPSGRVTAALLDFQSQATNKIKIPTTWYRPMSECQGKVP